MAEHVCSAVSIPSAVVAVTAIMHELDLGAACTAVVSTCSTLSNPVCNAFQQLVLNLVLNQISGRQCMLCALSDNCLAATKACRLIGPSLSQMQSRIVSGNCKRHHVC
jgi:hypothetical protein